MNAFKKALLTTAVSSAIMCLSTSSWALGVASTSVKSAINEPFRAVIELSVNPGEALALPSLRLGAASAHALAGVPFQSANADMKMELIRANKKSYIILTTKKPVFAANVQVVLEGTMPQGKLTLPVTFLLDPVYNADLTPKMQAALPDVNKLSKAPPKPKKTVKPASTKPSNAMGTSNVVKAPAAASTKSTTGVSKNMSSEAHAAHQGRIEALENNQTRMDSDIATLKDQVANLNGRVGVLENKSTSTPSAPNANGMNGSNGTSSANSVSPAPVLPNTPATPVPPKVGSTVKAPVSAAPAATPAPVMVPPVANNAPVAPPTPVATPAPAPAATTTTPPVLDPFNTPTPAVSPVDPAAAQGANTTNGSANSMANPASSVATPVDPAAAVAPPPPVKPAPPAVAKPIKPPKPVAPPPPEPSFLDENMGLLAMGGGAIVLIGVLALVMRRKKQKQQSEQDDTFPNLTQEGTTSGGYDFNETRDNTPVSLDEMMDSSKDHHEQHLQNEENDRAAADESPNFDFESQFNSKNSNNGPDTQEDELMHALNSDVDNPLNKVQMRQMENDIFHTDSIEAVAKAAKGIPNLSETANDMRQTELNKKVDGSISVSPLLDQPEQLSLPPSTHVEPFEAVDLGSFRTVNNDPVLEFPIQPMQTLEPVIEEEAPLDFDMEFKTVSMEPNPSDDLFTRATAKANSIGKRSEPLNFAISDAAPADADGRVQLELACLYAQSEDWEGARNCLRELLGDLNFKHYHPEAQRLLGLIKSR